MTQLAPRSIGPLAGVVVVDLTRVLAGPYCTMVLADLGARVIKVEMPGTGDDSRHAGPFVPGPDGESISAYFFSVNRNKESIALDMKSAADREVLDALIAGADVVVENFRPGVMDKLGLGWAALHARHERLILASISGFGQTGPHRGLPAYDMVVQAMGGLLSVTGPEQGDPARVGVSIGDLGAGLFGALGVQAALIERVRSGVGRQVDIAMLDCIAALMENPLVRLQATGKVPGPLGTRHPSISPFAAFRAQDGYVVIAAGNNVMFGRVCEALGLPALATDSRFASNAARAANHRELTAAMEAVLGTEPVEVWLERLARASVPNAKLNTTEDLLHDPQLAARDMLVRLPTGGGETLAVAGSPIRIEGAGRPDYTPAPLLDQHRGALLAELGMLDATTA